MEMPAADVCRCGRSASMSAFRLKTGFLLVIAVALIAYCPAQAWAQFPMPKVVDPARYTSPSGEYTLNVNPSREHGEGPADYRLTRRGQKVWSAHLPFTLLEAGVTDKGFAGGYAYPDGRYSKLLEIVILDRTGKLRLDDRIPRKQIPRFDSAPEPLAAGMFVDQTQDRLVVREIVWDDQKRDSVRVWRQYQLATGKRLPDFDPASLKVGSDYAWIVSAEPVPGTSLVLLHYVDYHDALFVLIDAQRKVVWSHQLSKDYAASDKDTRRQAMEYTARRNGAILPEALQRRFALWSVAHGTKTIYAVASGGAGKWAVTQVGLTPYPAPAPPIPKVPSVALRPLARINLTVPGQTSIPAIRGIWAFTFAGPGRIAFLRAPMGDKASLVIADTRGVVQHVTALPGGPAAEHTRWSSLAWLGGSRYVIGGAVDAAASPAAWFADTSKDTVKAVPGFDIPSVDHVASFPDGRFAVLGTVSSQYTMSDIVAVYSAEGKRQWRISNESGYPPNDPGAFLSPNGIAVTSGGDVAVADPVGTWIQYYAGATGKFIRRVDLKKPLNTDMAYTSDVWPDAAGGLIVLNFDKPSPILRIDAAGQIWSSFMPHYKDGRPVDKMVTCVQRSPEGKLWTTDQHSLLRLDETGQVDTVLGETANKHALRQISRMAIDPAGRIYAMDGRSYVAHVFNAKGTWQHACIPTSVEAPEFPVFPDLAVSPGGDVFLQDMPLKGGMDTATLRFTPGGKPLGVWKPREISKSVNATEERSVKSWWMTNKQRPDLVEAQGHILRSLSRRANGKWLRQVNRVAQSPSGFLAVFDSRTLGNTDAADNISLYDPTGNPIRTIVLPEALGGVSDIAYNGRLIVLAAGKAIYGMTPTGRLLWRFKPKTAREASGIYLFNTGNTLAVWGGDHIVEEYALPA